MSKCDKNLTIEAFCIPGNENNKYIIFITTDTYRIDIDNPDVKLVVKWNFSLLVNLIIHQIHHKRKKRGKATFLLFTPNSQRSKIKK